MKRRPLQLTLRQLRRLVHAPRFWGAVVAAAVVLALTGPYGTDRDLAFLPRLGYWLAVGALTFTAGYGTVVFLLNAAFGDQARHPLQVGLVGLAAGIPIAAITILINEQVFGALPATPGEILATLANSAVIAAAVSFLYALLDGRSGSSESPVEAKASSAVRQDEPPAPAQETTACPPLLDRLRPQLRGRLSHLSMQDHYVDVYTDKGHQLVLMRLVDAVREAAPVEGMQIHRSHWIALDAVGRVFTEGGRLQVEMADGTILPVARSSQAAVRSAGLPKG